MCGNYPSEEKQQEPFFQTTICIQVYIVIHDHRLQRKRHKHVTVK